MLSTSLLHFFLSFALWAEARVLRNVQQVQVFTVLQENTVAKLL